MCELESKFAKFGTTAHNEWLILVGGKDYGIDD